MKHKSTATVGRVQLTAHVEPEVRAELSALASANDRSVAAEIRRAIVEHVRHERPAQKAAS